jgi:hypothetical protein
MATTTPHWPPQHISASLPWVFSTQIANRLELKRLAAMFGISGTRGPAGEYSSPFPISVSV